MKPLYILLTFLLCLFSLHIFAQNWIPVAEGDVYHYELVGEVEEIDSTYLNTYGVGLGLITNKRTVDATIWVDSTLVDAGLSTYHFNKTIVQCDTCLNQWDFVERYYLKNQQQFLQHCMNIYNDGKVVLEGTDKWVIYPEADLGTVWIIDTLNNITAEVISIDEADVLGNMDSLKTIILSNNDTLELSKEHGIIRFPQMQDSTYYRLIGIQTRDLGMKIPGFKEIYDFEVGDIFQYDYSDISIGGGSSGYVKIEILGRTDTQDSITYNIRQQRKSYEYSSSWSGGGYSLNLSGIYYSEWMSENTFHTGYVSNIYPGQSFENETPSSWGNIPPGFNYSEAEYMVLHQGQNEAGKEIKYMWWDDYNPYEFASYSYFWTQFGSPPDLLYALPACGGQTYYKVWEEGLGQTISYGSCFESVPSDILIGYIKDGDTTGTVIPDSIMMYIDSSLFIMNEDLENEPVNILLYPNPARDQIHFNVQHSNGIRRLEADIFDTTGKVWKSQLFTNTMSGTFNVADLPKGIYVLRFKSENGLYARKFIKW